MVRVLRLYQTGMGAGHLPDSGGILDQSILMLDALNLMASFEAKINEKDAPPYRDDGEPDNDLINDQAEASWLALAKANGIKV